MQIEMKMGEGDKKYVWCAVDERGGDNKAQSLCSRTNENLMQLIILIDVFASSRLSLSLLSFYIF